MQFAYTAKTASGDIQTGHISAADVEAVKRALREQSLFLVDVRKKAGNSPFQALFGSRDRGALSKRDLLSVTTQLAIMIRSGVDLASAFQSLSQQCGNPTVRNILGQIHRDVTGGKSISDAMQAQASIFADSRSFSGPSSACGPPSAPCSPTPCCSPACRCWS
jgi:type II secretory pathway component PulF